MDIGGRAFKEFENCHFSRLPFHQPSQAPLSSTPRKSTYFVRMPKNVFNLLLSSGGFSAAVDVFETGTASGAAEAIIGIAAYRPPDREP